MEPVSELSNCGLILAVDDEPFVLNVVSRILRNAGFHVLPAVSGDEALAIGRSHAGDIDLLLSDVVMPGLRGPELADAFLRIHPETECLFMAGLPDTPEILDRILRRGHPFLAKPFAPVTLVNKVREVLPQAAHRSRSLVTA